MMICRDVTLWRLPANMVSEYDKNRRHNVTSLHLFDHEIGAIYSFVWRLRFSVYCSFYAIPNNSISKIRVEPAGMPGCE